MTIALFLLRARALFARVPRWVWIALAAAVALGLAVAWHGHVVRKALDGAHQRGVTETNAAWQARLDQAHAEALQWRRRYEAGQNTISQNIGAQNAEEARRIGAAADALRLRGPGAAAASCPRQVDHPAVPAPARQPAAAARPADGAGPAVPSDDRATVPWGWLVDRAEQCDVNRAEAVSWRDWYEQQRRLNEAERSAGGDPAP